MLLVGLVVGLIAWNVDLDPNRFLAAAALNDATVRIEQISCLAVDSRKVIFDQKIYQDPELGDAIAKNLSIKTVALNADYATCPWGFFVNVVPGTVFAVRYEGRVARYLVSIGICERRVDGSMNPNKCLSKNIYVFDPRVKPRELLVVALVGLAKSQAAEWEAYQTARSQ